MNSIFTCFPALIHLILVDPSDHHDNQNISNFWQKLEESIPKMGRPN